MEATGKDVGRKCGGQGINIRLLPDIRAGRLQAQRGRNTKSPQTKTQPGARMRSCKETSGANLGYLRTKKGGRDEESEEGGGALYHEQKDRRGRRKKGLQRYAEEGNGANGESATASQVMPSGTQPGGRGKKETGAPHLR